MTITGADQVRLDRNTDVRQVILPNCDAAECAELTRLLAAGEAEILPGQLAGWGREATLRTDEGGYYHVDIDFAD